MRGSSVSGVLFAGSRKISQIWRMLPLLGGHQTSITADHVVLVANLDMIVALAANFFDPHGLRIWLPAIGLENRPRPRQCIVDHGDLVDEGVGVVPGEVNLLFDDGLIVVMQRNSTGVECARAREAAGLDL